MKEKILPSIKEKDEAASAIGKWLGIESDPDGAADLIRCALEDRVPGLEKAYVRRLSSEDLAVLDNEDMPKFFVDMFGTTILDDKHVRGHLLQRLATIKPSRLIRLYSKVRKIRGSVVTVEIAIRYLKKQKWVPGGWFSLCFVDMFGIPRVFSGTQSIPSPGRVEEVYPRVPYHKLEAFQDNMKLQILEMLKGDGPKRGIITLPTGAGKTRIAVEAVVEFWHNLPDNVRFVVWIAQTEELCEQAVLCFKQIWEEKGTPSVPLRVFRSWKGRGLPHPGERGIIVAGIRQLGEIAKSEVGGGDNTMHAVGKHVAAVFIDEAHRSWTRGYLQVLNAIGIDSSESVQDTIPLIGLTATPMRTGQGETEKMLGLYGRRRIYPNKAYKPRVDHTGAAFDNSWSKMAIMRKKLTELGYLARPRYHDKNPGSGFEMQPNEAKKYEESHMLDKSLLHRIGENANRNAFTYDLLKNYAENTNRQILFFGASVNQALLMSRFLEDDGIHSAVITGKTRLAERKSYVRMFRDREVHVLCNYEVLATGFDAPKVDTVIIARPTSSMIVYQQMVGRGLRGPKFGGTKECDIITIEDSILDDRRELVRLGYMDYKNTVRADKVVGD